MGKGGGGGGGQPAAPTQQNIVQSNLPEYARPYFENLMNRAQAATHGDVYQKYPSQRIAGFDPAQQQAFQSITGMVPDPSIAQGLGILAGAATGALGAGQQYAQMATTPSQVQAYMSPYMQNVVDAQTREAQRQADIARTQRQMQAMGAQAFGGSRQALMEAEAQRDLALQKQNIQAQGLQNAFTQAQQAQQYGAGLGLQGWQTAGQLSGALGQLGQMQHAQRMNIAGAQQQVGAQRQALEQQRLTEQYQDFLNQVRYPYQQMAYMSDILRGVPVQQSTVSSVYQAPPSPTNQLMALGLGAYGISNLFGGRGAKQGGEVKGFAFGGNVSGKPGVDRRQLIYAAMKRPEQELITAARQGNDIAAEALTLKRINVGIEGLQAEEKLRQAQNEAETTLNSGGVIKLPVPDSMYDFADGGIVAFQSGGDLDAFVRRRGLGGDDLSFNPAGLAASNYFLAPQVLPSLQASSIASPLGNPQAGPIASPLGNPQAGPPASFITSKANPVTGAGLDSLAKSKMGDGNLNIPSWLTPPSSSFGNPVLSVLTEYVNPVTGEKYTAPTSGYTINTPIADAPAASAPLAKGGIVAFQDRGVVQGYNPEEWRRFYNRMNPFTEKTAESLALPAAVLRTYKPPSREYTDEERMAHRMGFRKRTPLTDAEKDAYTEQAAPVLLGAVAAPFVGAGAAQGAKWASQGIRSLFSPFAGYTRVAGVPPLTSAAWSPTSGRLYPYIDPLKTAGQVAALGAPVPLGLWGLNSAIESAQNREAAEQVAAAEREAEIKRVAAADNPFPIAERRPSEYRAQTAPIVRPGAGGAGTGGAGKAKAGPLMPPARAEPPIIPNVGLGLEGLSFAQGDHQEKIDASLAARAAALAGARGKTDENVAAILAKQLEQSTALEREGRGVTALNVAGKLLQSGKSPAAAIGEAFSEAGLQGAAYAAKRRELTKNMDQIRLAQANVNEARATGDYDAVVKAEDATREAHIKAAGTSADIVYKLTKSELERRGYTADQAEKEAKAAAHNAHARYWDLVGPAQAYYYRRRDSGALTPKAMATIVNNATQRVDSLIDKDPQLRIAVRNDPELRNRMIHEHIQRATQQGVASLPTSNFFNVLPENVGAVPTLKVPGLN